MHIDSISWARIGLLGFMEKKTLSDSHKLKKLDKNQRYPNLEMRRASQSDSETDENSEKSSSNEEENASNHGEQQQEVISEYEKQRLERIKENKARLEALRLPSLASSLLSSIEKKGKRKEKKKKGKEEDEEYKPSDGEERVSSSSNEEGEEEDEEDESEDASNSKGKSRQSSHKSKTKRYVQKCRRKVDFIDDDEALQQAIALSLEDSSEVSGALLHSLHNSRADVTAVELEERKRRPLVQEIDKRKKKRQLNTSRVQITEDQATIHFFQFDEAGKGGITVNDLRRVAIDHDFMWSDKEIYDMVDLFDSDGDGKLHLDDFQKILHRCNMIKG
ncbi:hypothetical protein AQUCO_03500208v1 [Aquilegia coerulea]|uniref:EF-hand domain-containing protein n=1 Tax=Aquilegia coerulea TaxID=218851 RepID=A0A2G5CWQ2_AQUCA|nr:hypothetical protein AQUCO_03500208v1 [Aquilegia coerulea]